ncbi:MAG: amino acid ABC transporter permease [Limnochordaceae bacterium]|uniref:Amino acid ABC transporter permease n=1 Tax=Carboxydichorda subterranea TaxID=3109565 RepID=A0ABZ1BYU9_9FIRM|nr:amino acid ABC transporter permease [Limnochorda sp. L945t]MBE3598739.1 amino acid ABC transporter permease [Limnochordaceae bacterium]WRP17994.1 amino acid ABC transporter permease [Limnochorda sp. L945t]
MGFRWDIVWSAFPYLMAGVETTLVLSVLSVSAGVVLGTALALLRLSRFRPLSRVASGYVDVFRGTPLLAQILFVFYGLPQILGFPLSSLAAGLLALSLNSAAYIAEIVRAGIQSIEKGQIEAAQSTGMNYSQTMRYIVLPQAFRRILPPLGNEFIAMLKDSSLVSVIALEDLMRRGQLLGSRTFRYFEVLLAVTILYLVMTKVVSYLLAWMERRLRVTA